MLKTISLAAAALLAGAGAAIAQPMEAESNEGQPSEYSYAWSDPALRSGIGVGVQVGGGVAGFTNQAVRDTLSDDVEGMWSARAVIGTHIPIGLELAYIGTTADIQPLGTTATGTLLGTDIEGAVRWNVLPHAQFNPYLFAGVGWQRFDVRDVNFNLSDTGVRDQDDLAVFPGGAGVAYRDGGLVLDVRGTIRVASGADLVRETNGDTAAMHTWDVGAHLGFEM